MSPNGMEHFWQFITFFLQDFTCAGSMGFYIFSDLFVVQIMQQPCYCPEFFIFIKMSGQGSHYYLCLAGMLEKVFSMNMFFQKLPSFFYCYGGFHVIKLDRIL